MLLINKPALHGSFDLLISCSRAEARGQQRGGICPQHSVATKPRQRITGATNTHSLIGSNLVCYFACCCLIFSVGNLFGVDVEVVAGAHKKINYDDSLLQCTFLSRFDPECE